MSYHGLPLEQLSKVCSNRNCKQIGNCLPLGTSNSGCYRAQCYETSRLLAVELKLAVKQYGTAFQSRLGYKKWIQPYLKDVLFKLVKQGVKNIAIATPSFVSDCLETLDELGVRAKQEWKELGGDSLYLVPCLNVHPVWVNAVTRMIQS